MRSYNSRICINASKIYHFKMNFTDLAIFLAYFKSDERFYHINPKERLNYSDCVKYCNSLDATLPAYNEKPYIQKFILDVNNGSKSIVEGGVIMHHGDPKYHCSVDYICTWCSPYGQF